MAPKVLLPDAVKQEIQALVSSNCKELVFQGRDAKETVQWDMMRKSYHGTESHTSHLKLFMQGKPPFDCCFNRVELQNNREGNEDRDSFMLELKEILHCTIGAQFFVGERGFTEQELSKSRGKVILGRTINDKALTASANFKFALRFANDFSADKERNPSGAKLEDMLLHVRKQMFVKFQGSKDQKGYSRALAKHKSDFEKAKEKAIAEGQEAPVYEAPTVLDEDDMPTDYVFSGYIAFVVFGPQGISKTSLSFFHADDPNVPKSSRKKARLKEAQAKENERMASSLPEDANRRGVSGKQSMVSAHLQQKETMDKRRTLCEMNFIASTDHQNYLTELSTINGMLDNTRDPKQIEFLESWPRQCH